MLLIIKANVLASVRFLEELRESICRQKEDGVIVLPSYCDPLLVPEDVEIRMEDSGGPGPKPGQLPNKP